MIDPLQGPGAVDLTQRQGLVLKRSYLISVSAVDVLDGGLHDARCSKHLRVVDVAQGIAWYVPLNQAQLANIARAAE